MKDILIFFIFFFIFFPSLIFGQQIQKITFFKNSSFPLVAYFIQGDNPGPTIMVQGGIQGDEICGVLTAEQLLKLHVKKGNLIVVPRANVLAIMNRKRGLNVDLNRRFDQYYNTLFEDYLANAIKLLASLSDGIIHLHEGSGFYSPIYIDYLKNPKRYGQSFIIDTAKYRNIDLEKIVKEVKDELNVYIHNHKFKFTIFNTNTLSPHTKYAEQKKSFTYYVLTKLHRPAFAIEVSKDIKNIKWKVQIQLKAVTLLLKKLGIIVENHNNIKIALIKNLPTSCKIYINGNDVTNISQITIYDIAEIKAYYDKQTIKKEQIGIFIKGIPWLNLLKSNYIIPNRKWTQLYLSIDGTILKKWSLKYEKQIKTDSNRELFVCSLNNKLMVIPQNSSIIAYEGDKLILYGTLTGTNNNVINVKGYISRAGLNQGQDIYSEVILDKRFFIKRYIKEVLQTGVWICEVCKDDGPTENPGFNIIVAPPITPTITIKDNKHIFVLDSLKKLILPEGSYLIDFYDDISKDSNTILIMENKVISLPTKIHIQKGKTVSIKMVNTDLATITHVFEISGK